MSPAAVFLCLVAMQAASVAEVRSDLTGRWRLVEPRLAPPDVAEELLVREFTAPPRVSIERRQSMGVSFARFTIAEPTGPAPHPMSGYPNIATAQGASLALKTGGAVETPRGSTGLHEETWSVGAGEVLDVVVTDQAVGAPPATLRLKYQRVPTPSVPGQNLLDNGTTDKGGASWWRSGLATIETFDGDPCLTVRDGGQFVQTVLLPRDVEGRYVLLIGSVLTERVNADGGITGLPSLYATVGSSDGMHIVGYFQGQQLLGRTREPNAWVTAWGIFQMPATAAEVSVQLRQASARGVPWDGSRARFDNLGVFVFATQEDARAFIDTWRGR